MNAGALSRPAGRAGNRKRAMRPVFLEVETIVIVRTDADQSFGPTVQVIVLREALQSVATAAPCGGQVEVVP